MLGIEARIDRLARHAGENAEDAEERHLAEQLADALLSVADRLRIAGAIRQEDTVRIHRDDIGSRRLRRDDRDSAAALGEVAQAVAQEVAAVQKGAWIYRGTTPIPPPLAHAARAALAQSLAVAGIRYIWEGKALGGRRQSIPDSPHVALHRKSARIFPVLLAAFHSHKGLTTGVPPLHVSA